MRRLALLLLLAALPTASFGQACTGLCLQQVSCAAGATTSVSGTVYAPNGKDPLPNVLVFIPNATVPDMTPGVACPVPGQPPAGNPLVGAITAGDGTFHITNVPVGANIPLVIQSGQWRRKLVIPSTTACTDTAFSTRMPRNKSEGDIPLIAVATGSADEVECVLRKVGIDDSEFTNPMSTGRIHLYAGSSSTGAIVDANTPSQDTLMDNLTTLEQYDMLMLPCQGNPNSQTTPTRLANFLAYANAGGRVYASHYAYTWMYQNAPLNTTVNWIGSSGTYPDGPASIDASFVEAKTLSDWLSAVGGSTTAGQIDVTAVKHSFSSVNPPTQSWLTLSNAAAGNPSIQFTFNTPVGSTNQCGRVLFNDYHVENPATNPAKKNFPSECPGGPMTGQEKLLEYSLFDLTSSGTLTLAPDTLDFGSEPVGFSTAPQVVTWTNHSIFPATIEGATATGDFIVQPYTCANVPSGGTCQIGVVYKPTAVGPGNGTLSVASGASIGTVTLTGKGISPFAVSTAGLGFPNTDVGASSIQSFTLTNIAPGPVPIPSVPGSGDFTLTNSCGPTLAVGANCTIQVNFVPSTTGSRMGSVNFAGSASVMFSGTGVDFSTAISPGSGTVIAGLGVSVPVTVLPISGYASIVTMSCTTTAPASVCTVNKPSFVPSSGAGASVSITTVSQYTVLGYGGFQGLLALMAACSAGLLWFRSRNRSKLAGSSLLLGALASACLLSTGCSGKQPAQNASYTAVGTYSYTVSVTDGFLTHTATYNLAVTAK